jgi:Ala-tRNA(Pro) deacylase
MAVATKLKAYLEKQAIDYELVPHRHTDSSITSASAAHVPSERLAKAVIVEDGDAYLMVVIPSNRHLHLGRLHHHLDREVGLTTEAKLTELFPDCDLGAIPPLGPVYGLTALVDEALFEQPEVFFESGDHEHLLKVHREQFRTLLAEAKTIEADQLY